MTNQHNEKSKILLNDLLNLKTLENVKIRFNTEFGDYDPIKLFKEKPDELCRANMWNNHRKNIFKVGETIIGLAKIEGDKWLLFNVSEITKDLKKE